MQTAQMLAEEDACQHKMLTTQEADRVEVCRSGCLQDSMLSAHNAHDSSKARMRWGRKQPGTSGVSEACREAPLLGNDKRFQLGV
jgi:hypothetical protein